MSPVEKTTKNNIQSTHNMSTLSCTFYDMDDNVLFIHDIFTCTPVDNMYDSVRSVINCPFDLIVKSHGKHGVPLDKNNSINLTNNNEFYVRKYTVNECHICMTEQSLVTIPGCSHTICLHCYEQVQTCPYCRAPFNRVIINP